MTSLLQLFITGLGAFIVSWIPLAVLVESTAAKELCSTVNIFQATKCVSVEAYAGVTYLTFIVLSLVYAEIKRKGIDASSSSMEILLHDYEFKKNYSQRVHAVRYAFTQALFAGIFVANIGYPFVIPAAASMLSEWEPDGARLVWNSGIGDLIINYWWLIPFLNIPIYWFMSMNRVGAEGFISRLQLTQKRIDYYSNHSSELAVALKESPVSEFTSGAKNPEDAQAENDIEPSASQDSGGRKWHETPLFSSVAFASLGMAMTFCVVIPKTFSIGLIFTTLLTLFIYISSVFASLCYLDQTTKEGRRWGYILIALSGFGAIGASQDYVYGLWGIDYSLRFLMSVITFATPLLYVGLRRIGFFPISWDAGSEEK